MTLTSCTLSGNSAENGGGIHNMGSSRSTVTLTNSTLSSNTAGFDGGGVFNIALFPVTLTNCTLSGNAAGLRCGGLFNYGEMTLNNTIVANSSGEDVSNFAILTGSNNLMEPGFRLGALSNTIAAGPALGPLQVNGGPTPTYALLPGSTAIDAGSNALVPAGVTTDQRGPGFPRIAAGTVDI